MTGVNEIVNWVNWHRFRQRVGTSHSNHEEFVTNSKKGWVIIVSARLPTGSIGTGLDKGLGPTTSVTKDLW